MEQSSIEQMEIMSNRAKRARLFKCYVWVILPDFLSYCLWYQLEERVMYGTKALIKS